MRHSTSSYALAALLLGSLLLSACGGTASNTSTSTPSSMLGTDSAATKVGGPAPTADSASSGAPGRSTTPPITTPAPGR